MKRTFCPPVLVILANLLIASLCFSEGGSDEIRDTTMAKHLESLGFFQDTSHPEFYRNTNVALNVFMNSFGLREKDFKFFDNSLSPDKDVGVDVEGNWSVVTHLDDSRTLSSTSKAPVSVVVNLAYARPAEIRVGGSSGRAITALNFIGAKQEPSVGGSSAVRFTLPNFTGIELEIYQPPKKPIEKPSLSTISKITVGESGKGFTDWELQKTQTVTNLPIARFRKRGQ